MYTLSPSLGLIMECWPIVGVYVDVLFANCHAYHANTIHRVFYTPLSFCDLYKLF